jgi:hypothetical protein
MAQFNFDASTVAPQASTGPVPAGTYLTQIIESDVAPLKSGKGSGLKLTFEIIDGQYKGRRIWENLNIQHENDETQRIAQAQLSALCHAVNVIKVQDTAALHHKPVNVRVVVREAQGQYQASNNIKGYESAGGPVPVFLEPIQGAAFTSYSTPAPTPAPAAVSKTPAWAKRS